MTPPASRGKASRPGILRILLVNLAVFAVLVLLFELVARGMGYADRPRYVPDGELLWKLVPNQVTRNHVTCRRVTIDERGMRIVPGAEDGPGRREVLTLGNSVTFGYGVADSETYQSMLQRALEAREPGRWRIRNGGVMGYNMYFMRLWLERLIERGEKPDLVLLSFTFNDRWTWPGEHYRPEDRERIRRSIHFKNFARSFALYNLMVERLAPPKLYQIWNRLLPFGFGFGPKAKPAGGSAGPDSASGAPADTGWQANWDGFYRGQVRRLLDDLQAHDVPVLAVVWPLPNKAGWQMQEAFMEVCRERGVPAVDLQPVLDRGTTPWPYFDPVHPDAPTFQALVDDGILPFFLDRTASGDGSPIVRPDSAATP